jgi:hypothetical protein
MPIVLSGPLLSKKVSEMNLRVFYNSALPEGNFGNQILVRTENDCSISLEKPGENITSTSISSLNVAADVTPTKAHQATPTALFSGVAYRIDDRDAFLNDGNTGNLKRVTRLNPNTIEVLKKDRWYEDNANREIVYNDPAVRLQDCQLRTVSWRSKPVYSEHNYKSKPIGKIVHGSAEPGKPEVFITGEFTDPGTIQSVKGSYLPNQCLSIGYDVQIDDSYNVTGFKVNEVSVVREGFFKGCHINLFASGDPEGNFEPFHHLPSDFNPEEKEETNESGSSDGRIKKTILYASFSDAALAPKEAPKGETTSDINLSGKFSFNRAKSS